MALVKGQSYEWAEILRECRAVDRPVYYLLHERGTHLIKAACLDIRLNPCSPLEMWPGTGPYVRKWADILERQLEPFHVFVRQLDKRHYYHGKFKRASSSSDQREIALRLAQVPKRGPIYKIIFFDEIR